MSCKTMFIILESPANALALSKDNARVVVAGRNVFKIFRLHDDNIVEVCNLRCGNKHNLNYAYNDVVWNFIDVHILATAATNGAVALWNLNKSSRSKEVHMFTDHQRTVNKVSFHMTEPYLLISGSQDGTMRCFDLRIQQAIETFHSNTESVRDVQFSPHQSNTFCAVSENGHVQLWDLRRPDRYFQNYAAHSGPIFTCDWHPTVNWLATASRDKTIKVWDLSVKATCESTINTMASVGKIKWRPQHKHQIASSSLVLDFTINVWDLRRPYIPFASFNRHKDVSTSFEWRGGPDTLVSIGRDSTLYLQELRDAVNPVIKTNPQGLAMDLKGDLMSAMDINTAARPNLGNISSSIGKPTSNTSTCAVQSALCSFTHPERGQSSFEYFARNYIMSGNFRTICDKNAEVAKAINYEVHEGVWRVLKLIYAPPTAAEIRKAATGVDSLNLSQMNLGTTTEQNVTEHNNDARSLPGDGPSGVCGGGDATEVDETPYTHNYVAGFGAPYNSFKRPLLGDFIFGEEDEEPMPMEMRPDYKNNLFDDGEDWVLPVEAFEPRHELEDCFPSPAQFPNSSQQIHHDSASGTEEEPSQLVVTAVPQPNPWDPSVVVKQALFYHVNELSDVQTAAMILIVIGENRNALNIDMVNQEHILREYIELLSKFKLFDVITEIHKLSWIPSIRQANQMSTTFIVSCSACKKPLPASKWICQKCGGKICSICHLVVRGLYTWCRFCSHGGHVKHIVDWFSANRVCPIANCGHKCEFGGQYPG